MGIIVGNGYSYIECDELYCHNRTREVYGEHDGQREVDNVARREGWRISHTTGRCTCPECWTKEEQRYQH